MEVPPSSLGLVAPKWRTTMKMRSKWQKAVMSRASPFSLWLIDYGGSHRNVSSCLPYLMSFICTPFAYRLVLNFQSNSDWVVKYEPPQSYWKLGSRINHLSSFEKVQGFELQGLWQLQITVLGKRSVNMGVFGLSSWQRRSLSKGTLSWRITRFTP